MKRTSLSLLIAAIGLAGFGTIASAQSYSDDEEPLTIERPAAAYRSRANEGAPVYGTSPYGYSSSQPRVDSPYRGTTRVYGYTRYSQPDRQMERGVAGGCGEYRFWDGDRCLDARDKTNR